ncbi:MAG: prepilin-type N-terminal cleavage/methylation domain-containing protein, partial [Pseudomonadota bacterium]
MQDICTSNNSARFRHGTQIGFTLIELLIVVSIIALALGLLLPALSRSRQIVTNLNCVNGLKQVGIASAAYSTSNDNKLHGLTWDLESYTQLSGIATPQTDVEAAVLQVIDIIRRHSNDHSFAYPLPGFFPYARYSHLVLSDYFDGSFFPHESFVCTFDAPLLAARDDPYNFDPTEFGLNPFEFEASRFGYSSSYYFSIAGMDVMQSTAVRSQDPYVVQSRWTQSRFSPRQLDGIAAQNAKERLENPRLTLVRAPSQKIMKYHEEVYHDDQSDYFFKPGIVQPMLFFDSSVQTYAIEDVNPGWNPRFPASASGARMLDDRSHKRTYYAGYMKWTRGGLRGIDVGRKE